MPRKSPAGKWCSLCDRLLWRERYHPRQWKVAENKRKCLDCQTDPDRKHSRYQTQQCIQCKEYKGSKDFSERRWKGRGGAEALCKACAPQRVSRVYVPGATYPCIDCHRGLPGESFRMNKTGRRKGRVHSACIRCENNRNRKNYHDRVGTSDTEQLLRDAARYDYAFARDVLGLNHPQIIAWLVRGYGDLDLESLDSWRMAATTPTWEPDPLARSNHLEAA